MGVNKDYKLTTIVPDNVFNETVEKVEDNFIDFENIQETNLAVSKT